MWKEQIQEILFWGTKRETNLTLNDKMVFSFITYLEAAPMVTFIKFYYALFSYIIIPLRSCSVIPGYRRSPVSSFVYQLTVRGDSSK
jgi:hypothetical protein